METKTNTLITSVVNSFTQDVTTQAVKVDPLKLLSGQAFIAQVHPGLEQGKFIMLAHSESECTPERAPFCLFANMHLDPPIDFANGQLELWVKASGASLFNKIVFTVYV